MGAMLIVSVGEIDLGIGVEVNELRESSMLATYAARNLTNPMIPSVSSASY